jgi:glucokinase
MKEYMIGIDIGGTNIRVGLISNKLEVVNKEIMGTKECSTFHDFRVKLKEMVDKVNIDRKADTIGFVLPTPWKEERDIIGDITNIPYLKGEKYSDIAKALPEYQVYFENDVNVISLLETHYGIAKEAENVIYITVSTGIGSGLVLKNRIYGGTIGYAGEVGYMPMYSKEQELVIFQDLCSGTTLMEKSKILYGESATASYLMEQYLQGETRAVEEIGKWLDYFTTGLVTIQMVIDPDIIVLGGPVIVENLWLVPKILEGAKRKSLPGIAENIKVQVVEFGLDAGLIGAGYYGILAADKKA